MSKEDPKTRTQERSYHKLFRQIADHCMAHEIDIPMAMEVLENYRPEVDEKFVKSTWKAILKAKTGKTSTTEQTREDVKIVQEEFGKLWSEITGEVFDWPSFERQTFDDFYTDNPTP